MAKRERKGMSEEKLSTIVKGLIADAKDYRDEIGEKRERSTAAYNGDPYGNEEEGRSQVITREVRDAVRMAMPSLMRVVFGSKDKLEFAPTGPEDVMPAKLATNYISKTVKRIGYHEYQSAIEDALVRKTGVFKAWWDQGIEIKRTVHTGLSEEQLSVLTGDDSVREIIVDDEYEEEVPGPDGQMVLVTLYDAEVIREDNKSGRLAFVAVPPEEFIVSRDARSIKDAVLVGHLRNATKSEIRGLGYSEGDLEDIHGTDEDLDMEEETRSVGNTTKPTDDRKDPSMEEVMFAECWVRVDYDGDGIAELRKIVVAGSGCTILENEYADRAMMVDLCPSPVAHQVIGDSLAQLVEDIQKIKSMVMRNTMDSLAQSIHPDVVAVENQVNFDDLLNTETGRLIRAKQPGMVQYMNAPFVGKESFPVLQYLDTMAESRTGMNQAAQGLNADALQSTAKSAIDNATQSAQAQIELIARNFMEGGLKGLYRMLLKLTVENSDRADKLRLNNQFIEVDPRSWNAEMDVEIKAVLGQGTDEQRLGVLRELAAKQELIIQAYGPDNPICGVNEYRNTLAEIATLGGIVDIESYLKDPSLEPPKPPQPPAPDPQMILAQSEANRVQHETQLKDRQFQLEVWKARQEDDRKRDEFVGKMLLEAAKAEASGQKLKMDEIEREINRARQGDELLLKLLQETTAYEQDEKARAQQAQQAQQQPRGQ